MDEQHVERAVYVASGSIALCGDDTIYNEGNLLILPPATTVELVTATGANVMLLGGAPLDGERHIYWNFVSSSLERLERAKDDWTHGRFGKVVGDEREFIPLPAT